VLPGDLKRKRRSVSTPLVPDFLASSALLTSAGSTLLAEDAEGILRNAASPSVFVCAWYQPVKVAVASPKTGMMRPADWFRASDHLRVPTVRPLPAGWRTLPLLADLSLTFRPLSC